MLNAMVAVPLELVIPDWDEVVSRYAFVKVTAVFGTFDVIVAITEEY